MLDCAARLEEGTGQGLGIKIDVLEIADISAVVLSQELGHFRSSIRIREHVYRLGPVQAALEVLKGKCSVGSSALIEDGGLLL